jgi:hypothetical protein
VSAPWWHPEANPLRDIQEFIGEQERLIRSLYSVPGPQLGPPPVMCPACGMTRQQCLLLFSGDPVHEQQRRDAYRRKFEEDIGGG